MDNVDRTDNIIKKVFIIAYAFPPFSAIGAQRPYRLAKYFRGFGWSSIVLTVKRSEEKIKNIRIIETEDKSISCSIKAKLGFRSEKSIHEQLGINISKNFKYSTFTRKLMKFAREVIDFPDNNIGWYNYALKSADDFLSKERVDVIISTSSPVTSHLIARKLKQKYKIPWVADLRDLWTQNHFYEKHNIIQLFEKRLELKTLSDADALVTVTPRFADDLKTRHKDKKVFCITNGYDPDDFKEINIRLSSKFTITYTGALCGGKRSPSLLFYAVKQLIDENRIDKDSIEIRFFGDKYEWLEDEMNKYGLNGIVKFYGFIQREKVIEKQKESQLLLLLLDSKNNERDVYPAKVFEYLGSRRPIIAYGGTDGAIKDLLERTNAGSFANDAITLRNVLLNYYQEFVETGKIKCQSNHNVNDYTYYKITKKYSEILDSLIKFQF